MEGSDRADAGFDGDVGASDADGRTTDLGAGVSGGDPANLRSGDGQAVTRGENPFSAEDLEGSTGPESGTPEDLKPGTRRTVGMDEDTGAGESDIAGAPGSPTAGG